KVDLHVNTAKQNTPPKVIRSPIQKVHKENTFHRFDEAPKEFARVLPKNDHQLKYDYHKNESPSRTEMILKQKNAELQSQNEMLQKKILQLSEDYDKNLSDLRDKHDKNLSELRNFYENEMKKQRDAMKDIEMKVRSKEEIIQKSQNENKQLNSEIMRLNARISALTRENMELS